MLSVWMVVAKLGEGTVRGSSARLEVEGSLVEEGKEREGVQDSISEASSSEHPDFDYQKLN